MKSFRSCLPKALVIALMVFSIFGWANEGFPAKVEVFKANLAVDGKPFIIKGVGYNPIPIGVDPETTPPYGDYFTSDQSPIYDRDLPLLRAMGANALLLWGWNNGADHKDFLDKAFNKGEKPIYAVISFHMDPQLYPDISSRAAREKIKADFRAMVAAYKSHPAVLMWAIGEEPNNAKMYGDRLGDFFSLVNEMILEARSEEGENFHPVTIPLGELNLVQTITNYETLVPNLDIWGVDVNRGSSFGSLFNDFRKASKKPLLITSFGIDAYDEAAEEEYEKSGLPYQATYAESLWREIAVESNTCLGGIVRAYSDEWWLGKTGNTLGGCPDPDPGVQSPCGHRSPSDPDKFVNYEWFGIMRVVKNGNNPDLVEPRKAYESLKSLWVEPVAKIAPVASLVMPKILPNLKGLDLTKSPTTEEIMAAGQLGGVLVPTGEIQDKNRVDKINRSFGEAIEAWNKHEYRKGVELFKKHVDDYPDSPWASEAILHVGCDCQYNGRYSEAERNFQWIIAQNKGKNHEGARRLLNKARLRLAVLKVTQNNFFEANKLFGELHAEGSDWRDRTYASHWIQRLSRYTADQRAMLNCGTKALAYLLEKDGRVAEARGVADILPETASGHSLQDLSEISSRYGFNLAALKISPKDLKDLPLPAIMQIQGKSPGDSGHYWILDRIKGNEVNLYDPQAGLQFKQTLKEFSKEWSGNTLVFSNNENLPGVKLSQIEKSDFYGGCCGTPRPEATLGNGRNNIQGSGNSCPFGSPAWSVNMVNLNLYVNDVPLWYTSKTGPSVGISISYNAQSAINQSEPFGNKWMFGYGSYLTVDTSENVTIFMPDGKRDVYTKTTSGYTSPPQTFTTLTKIAENHYQLAFSNGSIFVYNIPSGTPSQQPYLVEIRDPHNQSLTFGYDSNIHLTTITDALSRVTTLTYNAQGLVTLVTDPFNRTASFDYDANRNLVEITDMAGHTSTLTYDEDVYLTSIENQRGRWEFYIEPADAIGITSTYPPPGAMMYQNYRITVTNPDGEREEFHYEASYAHSWHVSPKYYVDYWEPGGNNFSSAPKTWYYLGRYTYNLGEIDKIIDPEENIVTFTYDSQFNRTGITDGKGNTTTLTYDSQGNVTGITDPLNNTAEFTYNTNNNLTSLTDPADRVYTYQYTGRELTSITDPKTGVTSFTYNSYGAPLTVTDAKSQTTTYVYDTSGNLTSVTSPGGTDSYTYDTLGRVTTHTDPRNNTVSFTYDLLNRIAAITYPDQTVKTFTYNCCGLSSVTDPMGTVSFTYDTLKRLTSVSDVYNKTIAYTYDKSGNIITLTYPDLKQVNYEYDRANRLIKVTDWLNNVTEYRYDLMVSNLVEVTYPNGYVTNYLYDNASRMKAIQSLKPDGTPEAVFNYTLNAMGNREGISYKQPLSATPTLSDTSYTHNTDNRLLTAGGTTFAYDNNGNLATKTVGSDVTEYGWDYDDMLTQVTYGSNTYVYSYDAFGNRVKRIVNGTETRFVSNLVETNASGNITAYYVYGLGLISKITPSNQAYHYHFDGLGNTVAITDSSGNVVNKYAYDAFGKVIGQDETISNPFKYVGQFGVMDEGNGLFYMRARYYDPEAGRFISKDPIGVGGEDINLYTYAANDPVNDVDPLGLMRVRILSKDEFNKLLESAKLGNLSSNTKDVIYDIFKEPNIPVIAGVSQPCKVIFQIHHKWPKYLGGNPKGPIARIAKDYHQKITNAFRQRFRYGESYPLKDPAFQKKVEEAMKEIYEAYPLP